MTDEHKKLKKHIAMQRKLVSMFEANEEYIGGDNYVTGINEVSFYKLANYLIDHGVQVPIEEENLDEA